MRRCKAAITIAAIMYVAAWFLPVVKGKPTLAQGSIPGWQAFRVALSPIWPYQDFGYDSVLAAFLGVASALSNMLFVVAAPLLWRWPVQIAHGAMWSLIVAVFVNAKWLLDFDGELRIGYYLWASAFLVLAFSAYLAKSEASAAQSSQVPA